LRRVAVFTEGQTEQITVRELLFRIFNPSKLSFECWELLAGNLSLTPYKYPNTPNPCVETHFMIINVHGDEAVISTIEEREKSLIEKGRFERIIGLRDMYSEKYDKRTNGTINDATSSQIIQGNESKIQQMNYHNRIKLYFAIMEIEAWILGMYNIFQRIDRTLTVDCIKQKLGIDLKAIDPQKAFYKPSDQLNSILLLCRGQYKKKRSEVEGICCKMESTDFEDARENGRCKCFDEFYREVVGCSE
jgi:hypothetical protein